MKSFIVNRPAPIVKLLLIAGIALGAWGLRPCPQEAEATVQQEVYITAAVESFGGYTFTEAVGFTVTEPGRQQIGEIIVEGLYNGPYPWIMRCYTDNLAFGGVLGAVRTPNPSGLISEDGRFSIPLEIQSPNFGVNVFRRIPDINEPGYIPYRLNNETQEAEYSDVILMGIDPRNTLWVAGPDEVLYTSDDNPLGDITIGTPFPLILRTDVSESAVRGTYDTVLYIEIIAAP